MIVNDMATYLWDARQAAEQISDFIASSSYEGYLRNAMLRSAVERQFGIIGEAFARLRRDDPVTASRISDLPRIVAFRNIIIHAYARIDNRLVWHLATEALPMLLAQLVELIEEAGDDPPL